MKRVFIVLVVLLALHQCSEDIIQTKELVYTFTDDNYSNFTQTCAHVVVYTYYPCMMSDIHIPGTNIIGDAIAEDNFSILDALSKRFENDIEKNNICIGSLDLKKNSNTSRTYSLVVSPSIILIKYVHSYTNLTVA